jgi:hypothetical protein
MKLKLLIKESYDKQLHRLNENILTDIMALILTPKLKKAMKSLKADPEFKELEQQIKKSKEELDSITKRLERNLEKREKTVADMKKAGIDVDINMTWDQTFKAYENWHNEFKGAMKSQTNFKKYFDKYYKK